MKKLNTEEIKQFADDLGFTQKEAKNITDLFYNLKVENPINNWKVGMPLNTVDDYIDEWENHWHREANWKEYYKYEKENHFADYDFEIGRAERVFKNLDTFKEEVAYCSYELSTGLIVIVC